jgi:Ca2+-binding EF-hand superfamily protein
MAELSAKQIRSIFDHYDRDRSGYIDASEWTNFLGVLDPTLSKEEAQAGLLAVDTDHDGRVGFDEFLKWWFSR